MRFGPIIFKDSQDFRDSDSAPTLTGMNDELTTLRRRHERLLRLYHVSQVIHGTLEPQQALERIVHEAVQLVNARSGSVALLNPTTGLLEILAAHGLPRQARELKLRVGQGITGWVTATGQAARVGDVLQDPRYSPIWRGVRSELAVPLEVGGEVRGVLNVDANRVDAFSQEDQEWLEALAEQAAQVIRNTWLFEQLRLKTRLLETLVRVGQTITSTLSLDEALTEITRAACALLPAQVCSLMLVDETGQWLHLRASHGAGLAYRAQPPLPVAESLAGVVVRRRVPIQVENVQTSALYPAPDVARREGLVSLLSVPLSSGDAAVGTLNVYTAVPHVFANEEIYALRAFAGLSAIALEKARLHERVVEAEERLRHNERLSALGLLAAEVAHEIRNPLTVMKMLYHSLNLTFPAGDPRARDAEILGRQMEHLNRVVERILALARKDEPHRAPVNLNGLLDDLCLLVRHKLGRQKIKLARRFDPELPAVVADATQLEQAFLNLLLNAVESMPQGGTLTLITGAGPAPVREVIIEVRDTGEGMTEGQQRTAFGSVLQSTKPKGSGLGLAIVRRVVEAHQGQMQIKSRPGRGTVVRLSLPIAPAVGSPESEGGISPPV